MSSAGFLSTSNTEMLWNIIMEDVVTTTFNENMVMKYIRDVFHKNLGPFFEIEGKNTNDLIVLNKKYISWILGTINAFTKKNANTQNTANTPKNDDNKLITVEDIHKNRQTQFEQDLNERQQEFTNYMTVKTPEVPKFSIDLSEDVPIKELEQTIKQMAAQRNYDVDMINKNNTNPVDAQNWLTPKETSVKNEKLSHKNSDMSKNTVISKPIDISKNNTSDTVKYIKIDTINLDSSKHNNVVDLDKHITWQDQMPTTEESNTTESNIFNKLKKININDIKDDKDVNIMSMQNDIHEMQNKISDMNNSIGQILRLLHKNE